MSPIEASWSSDAALARDDSDAPAPGDGALDARDELATIAIGSAGPGIDQPSGHLKQRAAPPRRRGLSLRAEHPLGLAQLPDDLVGGVALCLHRL